MIGRWLWITAVLTPLLKIWWDIIHVYNSKELNWVSSKLKWLENICVLCIRLAICMYNMYTWVGWIQGWVDSSCHHIINLIHYNILILECPQIQSQSIFYSKFPGGIIIVSYLIAFVKLTWQVDNGWFSQVIDNFFMEFTNIEAVYVSSVASLALMLGHTSFYNTPCLTISIV